jgi:AcrR family transcriptional regulator
VDVAATARGERTRRAFRDGAKAVVAQKGFLRTTITDISAAAGKSPASFYNYYDSKEDLLEELAEEFRQDTLQRAQPAFRSGVPVEQIMEDSVRAYWESYKAHLAELVGVFQVAMIDERFAERWREIRLAGIETIADGIRRAQRQGYCPGVDPWLTAGALGSMFEHFCYVLLAQGGAFRDRPFDDEDAIRTIASIWYHAVYWRPSESTPALRG